MDFNVAAVHQAIGAALGDRECIVTPTRRLRWADFVGRSRRLANHLHQVGLGSHQPRDRLARHQSGQDHLAVYLHNSPEYLEAVAGAFAARVAPFNVNWRYLAGELRSLLSATRPRALVYHGAFAPRLAEALDGLTGVDVLLQVDDGSQQPLLPGAVDYEAALAASSDDLPPCADGWSPDDLYIICTGGTTGTPKAVLWHQADAFVALFGGHHGPDRREWNNPDELVATLRETTPEVWLPAAPFMHGVGQWMAFQALHAGHTVVIPGVISRFDPDDALRRIEQERVTCMMIVGDAFARPLLDALGTRRYDLSSLRTLRSGGAALSTIARSELRRHLPGVSIVESMGSSESGSLGRNTTDNDTGAGGAAPGVFDPAPGTVVVNEGRNDILAPGDDTIGWLATTGRGRIPLGYLGDPDRTATTFPVIGGVRMAIPGDRARYNHDGTITVLGRDAAVINTGGEKVFAEEVEAVLLDQPEVRDAVVCGRPSQRWGSEIIALVQLAPGYDALDTDRLLDRAARRLARYKLPKEIIVLDEIARSPAGKPDYRWAREVAGRTSGAQHQHHTSAADIRWCPSRAEGRDH